MIRSLTTVSSGSLSCVAFRPRSGEVCLIILLGVCVIRWGLDRTLLHARDERVRRREHEETLWCSHLTLKALASKSVSNDLHSGIPVRGCSDSSLWMSRSGLRRDNSVIVTIVVYHVLVCGSDRELRSLSISNRYVTCWIS